MDTIIFLLINTKLHHLKLILMHEISDFFSKLFSPDNFPPRWNCGRWTSFHGWLYIISSILIALAYFSIPLILYYLIKKNKEQASFSKNFLAIFSFHIGLWIYTCIWCGYVLVPHLPGFGNRFIYYRAGFMARGIRFI